MESGWASDGRLIGITQPRRVAVVTLANRVAEEKMCVLGAEVGYCVRFDDVSSDKTKVKYVTDGILLREMMVDPLLTKYSILMIDEAHERSINTDMVLGLLRKIVTIRKDLRVIISSATLDAELFRDFFELNETTDPENDTSTIISVEGRMHPVTVFYTKNPVPNYVTTTVDTIIQLHKAEPSGDILAFLPGQDDVDFVCDRLQETVKSLRGLKYKLWIVPLYGALPAREQLKAFDSAVHDTRKVVVATNIAEASVTIPGIAYVIDCGFVKMRALNQENKIECLMTVPISQASAEQRAGRAGRIRPGKCYRLYPSSEFEKMIAGTVPEMQRTALAPMILQLKALGIQNVLRFHYLARPSVAAMIQGLELLIALKGVDEETGLLTNPLGTSMVDVPLPPMHAKTLISSGEFGCSVEIATIIAMMQIQDVFQMPSRNRHQAEVIKRKFAVEEGDHLTMLNVYANFVKNNCSQKWCSRNFLNYRGLNRARNIREQLIRHLKRLKIPLVSCQGLIGESAKIRRCIVNGFFSQAAFYDHTGKYHTIKENYPFNMYKGSVIMYRKDYPKWVVYTEVMQDSIRDISVIEPEWLYELAPQYYEYGTEGEIARKRKKVDNFDEKDKININ
uniref:RNA helicase n=1 Tax=Steinernema glaseri TaxID=37863 RepID=A0A1I7XZC5_9BILA